jgi:long-chain acyl-CoA synthetase
VFLSTLDGTTWTYLQVSNAVDSLAVLIEASPHVPMIGAYGGNDPLSIVALLAAWTSGLCLACCGRQTPAEATWPLFEMERCASVLAREPAHFEGGPWHAVQLTGSPDSGVASAGSGEGKPGHPSRPVDVNALACVCFTSGTTGKPKAITLTHRHLVEQVGRMAAVPGRKGGFRPGIKAGRPLISFSPFGHSGFFSWLGFALWLGRGIVLVDKFSVDAAVEAVKQYSPATLALTPTMIQMLATADGDVALPGVQYVTSSTAPLAPDVKEKFSARFGIPILQAYGMTELGNVAKEHLEDVLEGRQPRGSVGRISPGREVKIIDDDGNEVPQGNEGNLLVRAAGKVPSGVKVDSGGWFDTGDRGALTLDGILTITGRSTDRIIVGGFNVSPAEVESELRGSDLVSDAIVVAISDDRLGEVPVAGIVWSGEAQTDKLLRSLRGNNLAHYKLPRKVFTLEEVPRTAYGKVDRKKATEMARLLLEVEA